MKKQVRNVVMGIGILTLSVGLMTSCSDDVGTFDDYGSQTLRDNNTEEGLHKPDPEREPTDIFVPVPDDRDERDNYPTTAKPGESDRNNTPPSLNDDRANEKEDLQLIKPGEAPFDRAQ